MFIARSGLGFALWPLYKSVSLARAMKCQAQISKRGNNHKN